MKLKENQNINNNTIQYKTIESRQNHENRQHAWSLAVAFRGTLYRQGGQYELTLDPPQRHPCVLQWQSKRMSTCTDSIYIIVQREQGPTGGGAPTSRGTKVGKSKKGADFAARYLDTARSIRKSRRMSTCTDSIYIIVQREQGPTGGGALTSRCTFLW